MKDNSITVNNKTLSEHLREEDEIELEKDIKTHNIDSSDNIFYYQKPNLKAVSKREKNGRVIRVNQCEINFRNREDLSKKYLMKHQLNNAMAVYMIGCYKQERIITKDIAETFEVIILEHNIKIKYKSLFHAMRNHLGTVKKSSFGIKYINHVRNPKEGNYLFLSEEGYNIKPEEAVKLVGIFPATKKINDYKVVLDKKPNDKYVAEPKKAIISEKKEDCIRENIKDRFGIDLEELIKNGLTVNIFGDININLK